MPVKTWATNDVPTASDLNTQYRDQVISTVTSGTRPSGTEGQMIYETDTDLCYIYNGGWVRFGAGGAWTSYTPTLVQSGAVTKTVTYAKYEKVGRLVTASWYLSVTGTGVAANGVFVSTPFTMSTASAFIGSGFIFDTSANAVYPGIVLPQTTTAIQMYPTSAAVGAGAVLGTADFTAALAAGDLVVGSLTFESTT